MKTAAFADVNKQINYMKTDHVRGKIFKRREGIVSHLFISTLNFVQVQDLKIPMKKTLSKRTPKRDELLVNMMTRMMTLTTFHRMTPFRMLVI